MGLPMEWAGQRERRAVGWADLSTYLIEGQQGVGETPRCALGTSWMEVSFLSWFHGARG